MKTLFKITSALLLLTLIIVSCNKKSNDSTPIPVVYQFPNNSNFYSKCQDDYINNLGNNIINCDNHDTLIFSPATNILYLGIDQKTFQNVFDTIYFDGVNPKYFIIKCSGTLSNHRYPVEGSGYFQDLNSAYITLKYVDPTKNDSTYYYSGLFVKQ